MTKREFLQNVIALAKMEEMADTKVGEITMAEIKEFAELEIIKLDEKNAKRSSKPSKVQLENEPIKEKIVELITERNEKMVASAIAEHLEISTQKASALCRQLVEVGKLVVEEVKIPKKGKQKAYSIKADNE